MDNINHECNIAYMHDNKGSSTTLSNRGITNRTDPDSKARTPLLGNMITVFILILLISQP